MRLGAYVEGFDTPEQWAQIHIDCGYGAAYWPIATVNYKSERSVIDAYVDAAKRHGLVIAEVGAWCNLFDPDSQKQAQNMEYVIGQLRLADYVGAKCCVNLAGTLNADDWEGAHPDNLTDATFDRIVATVQHIIDEANPQRTFYAVEAMPWLYPCDIESMRRLVGAVNRPAFGVHADICNLVNSFDKVYRTGEMTHAFFSAFGPLIKSVHAKDTVLSNKLTVNICEAIPGRGIFDYDALLTECSKLDPDLPVMAEHLETQEEYIQATDFINAKAEQMGLHFILGH